MANGSSNHTAMGLHRRPTWRRVFWILRLVVAGVFVAAAVPKIRAPWEFALVVSRYDLLPAHWVNAVALSLPWVELTVALAAVAAPRYRTAALSVMSLLLAVFAGAMILSHVRGNSVACGCFATDGDSDPVTVLSLVRDGVLLVMAAACLGDCILVDRRGAV